MLTVPFQFETSFDVKMKIFVFATYLYDRSLYLYLKAKHWEMNSKFKINIIRFRASYTLLSVINSGFKHLI